MRPVAILVLLLVPVATISSTPQRVIFDHDGGIDDFVTLLLLLAKPELVSVIGVTILDADCRAEVAANTTLKLLHTLGFDYIPVAVSTLPPVNPFPDAWRWSGISVDVQPLINNVDADLLKDKLVQQAGQDYLWELLRGQPEPVTIVATGPLSNVAYVLKKYGNEAVSRIKEVWWMGGAVHVPGNVHYPGHDGSAEWNAFWDPPAVGIVWESSVPVVMVPLDVTNRVPVTPDLIYRFGRQANHLYSVLAGTVWSRVISWVYERPDEPYFAWDTLTAACLLSPGLCKREENVSTYTVVTGPSAGRVAAAAGQQCVANVTGVPGPRTTAAILDVDAEDFNTFVLDALRR
jgi:purine nucleosidase